MKLNSSKKGVKRIFLLFAGGVLLTFFAFVNLSANTAYTGIRTITGLQFTADMGAGWNLGNTMDATGGETSWGNPITTQAMINTVKAQGFKTIRIPTTWYSHLGSAPNYTIDATWLSRVETICNYAFANDMYVILNTHHEGGWCKPTYAQETAVTAELVAIWTQIANRFKNYGDYLIFETLNEPRLSGSAEEWTGGTAEGRDVVNRLNKAAVNAIRATGGNNASRFIMCPSYAASGGGSALDAFVVPNNDSKVIVSIHNYGPNSLCLSTPGTTTFGASEKTSIDNDMNNYYNKFISKGRAAVIGEWGSVDKSNTSARTSHADYFVNSAKSKQLATVLWDNGGHGQYGFGQLNRSGLSWYFPTIVNAITSHYSCSPTSIIPNIQVNGGSLTQASSATIVSGAKVVLSPEPSSGGSWSWSGLGTSGSSREQTIYPTASGTATATYTNSCGIMSTQNFTITVSGSISNGPVSGGTYTITARHSGKVLDVIGNGTADGAIVQQWTNYTTTNQQWVATDVGNGYWRLSPANSTSKALDVSGASTTDGASAIIWSYSGTSNQQWQVVANGSYYNIKERNSGKCLDINGASTADGGAAIIWSCGTGTNQQFSFTRLKSAEETTVTGENAKNIRIYPNPSKGAFTIEGLNGTSRLQVFDLNGKLVYSQEAYENTANIKVRLNTGAYFVKVANQGKVTSLKLFIQ